LTLRLAALPDAVVEEVADVPDRLDGATRVGPYSAARPRALLRVVPGLARFLARDGDRLDYAMEPGGDRAAIGALLDGPLTAALIHQRGELPLHAATFVPPGNDAAIALAGDKGAGKSTLAFELLSRGWALLNDDLSRTIGGDGRLVIHPGRGGIRLREDSCRRFGLDTEGMRRVPGDEAKFLVEAEPTASCSPLRALVAIDRGGGDGGFERVAGADAVMLVARYAYRPAYVAALGVTRPHLAMAARVAGECTVGRLRLNAPPEMVADALADLFD
jgi:hypothetical protein